MILLRDNRKLIGKLRSFDQYGNSTLISANLILQDTIERFHIENEYGDLERGVFIVRGDNIALMGQQEGNIEDKLVKKPINEILERISFERQETEKRTSMLFSFNVSEFE